MAQHDTDKVRTKGTESKVGLKTIQKPFTQRSKTIEIHWSAQPLALVTPTLIHNNTVWISYLELSVNIFRGWCTQL